MRLLIDSFWRAVIYCLHPRVIGLALLPLVVTGVLCLGLSFLFWEPAVAAVRSWLVQLALIDQVLQWLTSVLGPGFRAVVGPLFVILLAIPVVVSVTFVLVALCVGPVAVEIVARRRFPSLERRHGGGWWRGLLGAIGSTLAALSMLLVTLPLWLIPPFALVLPPLIWGWLAARVLGFDALAEHASVDERRALLRAHRWPLLLAGVSTGVICGLPTALWTMSAGLLIMGPFVMVAAVWLYTMAFTFSALWFTHYALCALDALRRAEAAAGRAVAPQAALPLATPGLVEGPR